MNIKKLKLLRLQLIFGSILWTAAFTWFGFINAPNDAFLTKESPEVLDRMDRECTGSYAVRYDCKNAIAIEVSTHAMIEGAIRLALVLIGPFGSAAYYGWLVDREPPPPPSRPSKQDDMSWKTSAQSHVMHGEPPPMDDDDGDYPKY